MKNNFEAIAEANSITFKNELQWLDTLFHFRAFTLRKNIYSYLRSKGEAKEEEDPEKLPQFEEVRSLTEKNIFNALLPDKEESPYAGFLNFYDVKVAERAALALALVSAVAPMVLEKYAEPGYLFPLLPKEFGFKRPKNGNIIPTCETLFFLIAGSDLAKRFKLFALFEKDHFFSGHNILSISDPPKGQSILNANFIVGNDFMDLFLRGEIRKPDFSPDFPAKLLDTAMDWEDLVLPNSTLSQLQEIEQWITFNNALSEDKNIGRKLKPGFRVLFYGLPGTGKTLAATLVGKKTGRDVYRIDLSTVVSKYIGETEKNLRKLFDRAGNKNWILFFDEADALFGKRTNVNDSHDRYANQEVSYLLQRIEYFEGMVILASNMKNNIDSAFIRRFQSIVYFPMPKSEERLLLWKKAFPEKIILDETVDLNKISADFELSGAHILNIAAHCSIKVIATGTNILSGVKLRESIARELAKEGRTM